ncbi:MULTISPECIES: ribosome silencing factor [Bacillaceae]|jgi:ribosome-associated protein|uniref:ribosome silencing factor n=1 Tax=Bacillaceae TaxID=186817 RepID=UPI000BA5A815|nr:ribosome silencing factor [Virgibacillus sp. 7505]PAE17126.1 ribosome silencing factor [Virgibacillus sp. 7505]
METIDLAQIAANAADAVRGEDVVLLEMKEVSLIADYFMICHGTSERQVQAIARRIKEKAEEAGVEVKRLEGLEQSRWVLVDLGDVVCHVFHIDERRYYNLERLWGDAPQVEPVFSQES